MQATIPVFAQLIDRDAPDPVAPRVIESVVIPLTREGEADLPPDRPGQIVTPARALQTAAPVIGRTVVIADPVPDVLPTPTLNSEFGIPEGLRTSPDLLFARLGYGSPASFHLTPRTCFEVACKCYANGLFLDALAFTNHGLKLCNHARLYLLKAMCEISLNRPADATATLVKYRTAAVRLQESVGLREARERLNGPVMVRIQILMDAWDGNP